MAKSLVSSFLTHAVYTNRRSQAQRKLMPYVAGYWPGRARPMGPLQRLGRNFAICL